MAPACKTLYKEHNIQKNLDQFDNREELDEFLSLFIAWLKRKDGKPFKDKYYFPKALKCLDGKMRFLQTDGYDDTNSSDSLTSEEITA
ncbi:35447_t:CDS:2, partial [Gigaspora margarita]